MEDYVKGSTINDSVSVFLRYLIGRCQQTHETHFSKIVSKYTHSKSTLQFSCMANVDKTALVQLPSMCNCVVCKATESSSRLSYYLNCDLLFRLLIDLLYH